MTTEVEHTFEGIPILRLFNGKEADIDVTLIDNVNITYLPDLYDGYAYVDGKPYQVEGLIKVGMRREISKGNSTMEGQDCKLCYGQWIVRNADGLNINTVDYIGKTIEVVWVNYLDGSINLVDRYPITIVNGVDIMAFDIYLSLDTTSVIKYLNARYSIDVKTFDLYLVLPIDNYNGVLLHVGSV